MTGSGGAGAAMVVPPVRPARIRSNPEAQSARRVGEPLTSSSVPEMSSAVELHLASNRNREHLEEAAHEAAVLPAIVGHLLGARDVISDHPLEPLGHPLVVDDEIDLVVEGEGTAVQVGAAYRGPAAVHHHGLGMEEGRTVLVHLDARLEQPSELAAAGPAAH